MIAVLKNTSKRTVRTKGTMTLFDGAGAAVSQVPLPDVPLLPEREREVAIPVIDGRQATARRRVPRRGAHRRRHAGPDRRRNDAQGSQVGRCARSSVDSRLRPSCSTPASPRHSRAASSSPAPRRASSAARSASPASTVIDPDFGVSWIQPGVKFGSFEMELRDARRADRLHLGRNYAALRDLKTGGCPLDLRSRRRLLHPRRSTTTASRTSPPPP